MVTLFESKALLQLPPTKSLLQLAVEKENFINSIKHLKVQGLSSNIPLTIFSKVCIKNNKVSIRLDLIQSPTSAYIEFFVNI